eukprot:Filipodium_phascolosomae@DN8814_c0_g1_i1.p1
MRLPVTVVVAVVAAVVVVAASLLGVVVAHRRFINGGSNIVPQVEKKRLEERLKSPIRKIPELNILNPTNSVPLNEFLDGLRILFGSHHTLAQVPVYGDDMLLYKVTSREDRRPYYVKVPLLS